MKKYIIGSLLLLLFSVLVPAISFAQLNVDVNASLSACPSFVNNLRYKSIDKNTAGEVSKLQSFLRSQGYLKSEPTGYFGLMTQKAVKDFQSANGVDATGLVGPLTRGVIELMNSCENETTATSANTSANTNVSTNATTPTPADATSSSSRFLVSNSKPPSSALSVNEALGDVSFNNYSSWYWANAEAMPFQPSPNGGGGFYFDFPIMYTPLTNCYNINLACPYVGYLMTRYSTPITGKAMSMTAQVTATGNPVFQYMTEPHNTCVVPAKARFIIQYSGDNGNMDFGRWWSTDIAYEIKPGGVMTITVPLTPDKWTSVLGKKGDLDASTRAGFQQALNAPGNLGITFGGGCYYAHGVNILGGTGTAKFIVTDYTIKANATSPIYSTASIANAASATNNVTGDGWVSIYGQDLISDASCANLTSLANSPVTSLCGTSVKVNGQLAQLSYADKNQINFLAPNVYGAATVEVTTKDGTGPQVPVNFLRETMDLFTQTQDGKGIVSAQHWTTPGIPLGTLVSTQLPARENYPLVIYAMGLGAYGNTNNKPTVMINNRPVSAQYINYSGFNSSPGQYQVNLDRMSFSELGITQSGTYSIQLCGGGVCGNKADLPVTTNP